MDMEEDKKKNLKNKKVLCTIHHFEEKDFEKEGLKILIN